MDWTTRIRRLALAAAVTGGVLAGIAPAPALGSYHHRTCAAGGGPTDVWRFDDFFADVANGCAGGGVMRVGIDPVETQGAGAVGSWTYLTANGLRPRTMIVRLGLRAEPSRMSVRWERLYDPPRAPSQIFECSPLTTPCAEFDPREELVAVGGPGPADGGRGLRFAISCQYLDVFGAVTDSCDEQSSGALTIGEAFLRLEDLTAPGARSLGGGLASEGTVSGTAHLTGTATDVGSGVKRITAEVDGASIFDHVESNGGRCVSPGTYRQDPVYDYQVPCPLNLSFDVPVDTTAFAEGQHVVTAAVTDVDGNRTTVFDRAVAVDNVAPPANTASPLWDVATPFAAPRAGDVLRVDRGSWTGDALAFRVRFRRCPAGGGTCTAVRTTRGVAYTVLAEDVGFRIAADVIATNSEGISTVHVAPGGVVRAAL